MGDIAPDDAVTLRYRLHTFTSLVNGDTLINTMTCSSTNLTEAGVAAAGAPVDDTICGKQPVPTPSPTPTETPFGGMGVHLPLVMR